MTHADLPVGVSLTLEAPERVRLGDSVRVLVRVSNGGQSTAQLYLRGSEATVDVEVMNERREVWRVLEQAVIPALLRLEMLAPGQSLEAAQHWKPTERGTYRIVAMLLGERNPYVTSAKTVVVY